METLGSITPRTSFDHPDLARINSLVERPRLIEYQANQRINSLSWIVKAMGAQMRKDVRNSTIFATGERVYAAGFRGTINNIESSGFYWIKLDGGGWYRAAKSELRHA